MAISRMQQPRQNYGLGSFVKKVTRKVTKPFTKLAKKLVPKEIAGVMRAAAPFLPPGYREAAYLLGTAKQTGRISPMDLALTAAPTISKMQIGDTGQTIGGRIGAFKVPGMDTTLKELAVGGQKFIGPESKGAAIDTAGIFGKGGQMFQIGSGGPGILDTKAGEFLLGGKEAGTFSKSKIAGLGVGVLSLISSAKTPQEAGTALANQTGNSDDYERGAQLFAQLKPELFQVPEQFRMPVKDGGLMRTNFAMGSDEDPKPLPSDPTEPVNPFRPKPIGPFPSKKASVDDPFYRREYLDENAQEMFKKPYKDLTPDELEEFREEMERLMNKFSKSKSEGIMMAGLDRKEKAQMLADELAEEQFGMDFYDLDIRTQMKIYQIALDMIDEGGGNAMGGLPNDRTNFALGTMPTAQESGLGGLPIEADMRYTGGFMPYGAKEKADDVPARLSKNEFVFTADAVRAAGGGSVQKGAQKMYNTMKQLEAKPEAKGMMA